MLCGLTCDLGMTYSAEVRVIESRLGIVYNSDIGESHLGYPATGSPRV